MFPKRRTAGDGFAKTSGPTTGTGRNVPHEKVVHGVQTSTHRPQEKQARCDVVVIEGNKGLIESRVPQVKEVETIGHYQAKKEGSAQGYDASECADGMQGVMTANSKDGMVIHHELAPILTPRIPGEMIGLKGETLDQDGFIGRGYFGPVRCDPRRR